MKHFIKFFTLLFIVSGNIICQGQEIQTLLDSNRVKSSGGYGALTNKFTSIGGKFANLTGIYGGWYINHKVMLGIAGAAVNNHIPVPSKFSAVPGTLMSYEYGQFGFMSEYVLKSNRLMHLSFQLFAGMGFNTQYNRFDGDNDDTFNEYRKRTDWFIVTEPGVNVELNVLKWMRFCPGVSYRLAMETGSPVNGLKAGDISGASINAALKFGKF
jgi:hypothetical protein